MNRLNAISLTIAVALMLGAGVGLAADECVRGAHRYEGSPKPNVYVVTIYCSCEETQAITVRIHDAIYGEEAHRVEFTLAPGENREIRYAYAGEKYFSYAISHSPAD